MEYDISQMNKSKIDETVQAFSIENHALIFIYDISGEVISSPPGIETKPKFHYLDKNWNWQTNENLRPEIPNVQNFSQGIQMGAFDTSTKTGYLL
ncbi:MAG: hypothetical protein LBV67_04360, partial [Streptococcaceae bacterium]|nr:hypothetical protein [Streptococcaceae bacterium]